MVLKLTIQSPCVRPILLLFYLYNMDIQMLFWKLTFYNEDNFLFYPTYLFNLNLYNK